MLRQPPTLPQPKYSSRENLALAQEWKPEVTTPQYWHSQDTATCTLLDCVACPIFDAHFFAGCRPSTWETIQWWLQGTSNKGWMPSMIALNSGPVSLKVFGIPGAANLFFLKCKTHLTGGRQTSAAVPSVFQLIHKSEEKILGWQHREKAHARE